MTATLALRAHDHERCGSISLYTVYMRRSRFHSIPLHQPVFMRHLLRFLLFISLHLIHSSAASGPEPCSVFKPGHTPVGYGDISSAFCFILLLSP